MQCSGVQAGLSGELGSYKLVSQFPRRVIGLEAGDATLSEAGLTARHEALLLEPLSS